MNILFLYSSTINPQVGGVERVTFTLANYFESKGHNVFFLGFIESHSINDNRQFFLPDSSSCISEINISFFTSFLLKKTIDCVVNQGGTSEEISKLAYNCKLKEVKLISVVHNSLLATIKNFSFTYKSKFSKIGLSWILPYTDSKVLKNLLLKCYKQKYARHYQTLCKESDYVFLLSEKYKEELMFFMDGQSIDNVIGIPNPVSFNEIIKIKKKKEILYVGRVNTSQKRVDLLLQIWGLLDDRFTDWSLKIVGDGDELESMKVLSSKLNLQNVFFYGFRDPKQFYESASIFCMTSSFEGLPMTLIEAMQYGVVPVAFNSFISATDIIDDKVNGCLIRAFNINEYVDTLSKLMSSEEELERCSRAAEEKIKVFDLSIVGEKWLDILEN
ncbi:glycosyltransferase [Flavobacterium sp. FBOR7N2.3]|uniref:Glycosyltransferase n=1 Tax=Flavobacterium magnesitis TaxID=3138077 RepID=A0ABV4TF86_9FLAO